MKKNFRNFNNESGVTTILVTALLALVLVPICAFVIDLGRAEVAARQLQAAADAAAVASTTHLGGYAGGVWVDPVSDSKIYRDQIQNNWKKARRVVLMVLRNIKIFGDTGDVRQPGQLGTVSYSGPPDLNSVKDAPYLGNVYNFTKLEVKIERGLYLDTTGSDNYQFRALEGDPLANYGDFNDTTRMTTAHAVDCKDPANRCAFPGIANAARVTLTLELDNIFSKFFFGTPTKTITRVGVSARDNYHDKFYFSLL